MCKYKGVPFMYDNLPQHLAIIMDGNGRWAKKRFLTKAAGHKAGADTLQKIADEAEKLGIKHLTVYAFSTENWRRPQDEVNALMNLLRDYLKKYIRDSKNRDTKVDVIGDVSALDSDIIDLINTLKKSTENKPGMNLHIALNYGGRDEIIRAVNNICNDAKEGKIDLVSEAIFSKYLDTASIPDPELLIRTSGECRLSNFLLWQVAYTEFVFVDKLWPDFNSNDLHKALDEFSNRNRRFGGRI